MLNGDAGIAGTAYISENHFCFQGGALKVAVLVEFDTLILTFLNLDTYSSTNHIEDTKGLEAP